MISSPFDRLDYPSLRQSVYLNQASLGLIGQPAVTAMHTFIDNVARHGNLYMSDRDEVKRFRRSPSGTCTSCRIGPPRHHEVEAVRRLYADARVKYFEGPQENIEVRTKLHFLIDPNSSAGPASLQSSLINFTPRVPKNGEKRPVPWRALHRLRLKIF